MVYSVCLLVVYQCIVYCYIVCIYICVCVCKRKIIFLLQTVTDRTRKHAGNRLEIFLNPVLPAEIPENTRKSEKIILKICGKSGVLSHKTSEYDIDTAKRRRFIQGIVYIKSTDLIKRYHITISLSFIRKKFILDISFISSKSI